MPPTASVVLPSNVGQVAASRVYVRGNGGMVLVRDVNLSSCYSSTPPSLGVRNWKVVLPSLLVMRKFIMSSTNVGYSFLYVGIVGGFNDFSEELLATHQPWSDGLLHAL